MVDTEPAADQGSKIITLLASAVTVAGSVLGTVGISAGLVTSLLRNKQVETTVLLTLAGLAILVGVAAAASRPSAWPGTGGTRKIGGLALTRTRTAVAAALVFGLSTLLLLILTTTVLRTNSRPVLSTTLVALDKPAGHMSYKVGASASGVSLDERYLIRVQLLGWDLRVLRTIYYSYVGPSADGTLGFQAELFLPPLSTDYFWVASSVQLQSEVRENDLANLCGVPPDALRTGGSATPTTRAPSRDATCSVASLPRTKSPPPTADAATGPPGSAPPVDEGN